MDADNIKLLTFYGKERYVTFFYTPFESKDFRKHSQIEIPDAQIARTGLIPGLYVFDNIISEEEEKEMIRAFDEREWVKLLKRRVQHYGYEFVYGANNINKNNKIGDMPDFVDILAPSKFS